MTLAVMQPYFFPYIGYFQLIHAADRFVLADEVQYIRHGWINRNRILKPSGGNQYLIVPVAKHHYKSKIGSVYIAKGQDWKAEIYKKLSIYKKAPEYNNIVDLIQDCICLQTESISELNKNCIEAVCQYIGIKTKIEVQSELSIDYSQVYNKTDRVVQLCRQLGASAYLNPIGGEDLYSKADFKNAGITLQFIKPEIKSYKQFSEAFEPSLSIIDVLMFNKKETISGMLNAFELV